MDAARLVAEGGSIAALVDYVGGAPTNYCTAGTTSNGCNANMSVAGIPSVAAPAGFTLSCTSVEGDKLGLIFYGINGRKAASWTAGSTSYLCLLAPVQRLPISNSGGSDGTCDGTFTVDFLDYLANHPTALGQPFAAGTVCGAQAWFRDPAAPGTTNLSNAIEWMMRL